MASLKGTITPRRGQVVIGVDTHRDTHVAVALDHHGTRLGELAFPSTAAGTAAVRAWARTLGSVSSWGVEGSASYGAGLARTLLSDRCRVVEVNRPDRHARRMLGGKSDPIDAEAAARSVLAGHMTATPKSGDGPVEMLRHVRMARNSAVKAKTATINQIKAVLVTAPPPLRERYAGLSNTLLIKALTALQPGPGGDLNAVIETTLASMALRWRHLEAEAKEHHRLLGSIVTAHAPALLAEYGLGPDTAAALLITAGDNPDRLHSEAGFAALCGVSPIPASSGRTARHRLNRGGDRQANAALHRVALVRMAGHQQTRAYIAARRAPNKANNKHLMRCLKRYIARDLYPLILQTVSTPPTPLPAAGHQ